ncbi:diacylglycerol kinase family lipid kinase [Spirochaetota bacterium]
MNTKQKMLLILNPVAGMGKAKDKLPLIQELLNKNDLNYETVLTEYPRHATELAKAAASFDIVIAAGGDGTVNEVASGLMQLKNEGKTPPALAVLCVGRGNDFAYGADVPPGLAEGIDVIAAGIKRPMDMGFVKGGDYPEGKYFANGIGAGFDTIVGLEAAKMKFLRGAMAYVAGAIKTLYLFPDAPVATINSDGAIIEQPVQQISIMNGKRMGGSFFMAPQAENHDGFFDLCIAERLNRREMLNLVVLFTKGTQAGHPKIKTRKGAKISIVAPNGGLIVHADGETVCIDGNRLDIECLPAALEMVCDPGRVSRLKAREKKGI